MNDFERNTIEDVVLLLKNYNYRPLPDAVTTNENLVNYVYRAAELTAVLQIVTKKLDILL